MNNFILKFIINIIAENQTNLNYQFRLILYIIINFNIFSFLYKSRDEFVINRFNIIDEIKSFLFKIKRKFEIYKMRIFHFKKTEKMLKKKHSFILTNINNLILILSKQSKYEKVEKIYQQTLTLKERVLRKKHSDTLTNIYCFIYLLHQKKRYNDTKMFYHRTYAEYRKTFEKHSITVACSRHYSLIFKKKKD